MAAIIGAQFCNGNATDINVVRSVILVGENLFVVTDINSNIMFRVKNTSSIIRSQRTLLDSNDTPIVTFRPKIVSAHHQWIAYRGDGANKKDIIFTAKQSSIIRSKTDLNINFPNNGDEDVCNFKVDGSFVFYKDNIIIAEPKEQMVKISENVDSAFIVSLIVILDAISEQEEKNKKIRKSFVNSARVAVVGS